MDFTEITLKLPKSTELFFAKNVDIDSASDFNESLIETINEYDLEINNNKAVLQSLNIDVNSIKYKPIEIYLHTYGGSIYDGFATHNIISEHINKHNFDINIKCSGHVMSMGIILLLSVPYENRFAFKNTTFMIHTVASMEWGKIKELEDNVKETKRLHNIVNDIILKNTDITQEQLDKVYREKIDWYIDAEEALKLKLISKII